MSIKKLSEITGTTSYSEKLVAIGVPCYKCKPTIDDLLCSIMIQSIRNDIKVILSPDDTEDYSYLKERYPMLDIELLPTPEKNAGPGVTRQRVLNYLYQMDNPIPYVTFIDADDVLISPHSLESLLIKTYQFPKSACIQGVAAQELDGNTYRNINGLQPMKMNPTDFHISTRPRFETQPFLNPNHPWVFGRLYKTEFLQKNNITFGTLRAMEDSELNVKLRMLSNGTSTQTVFTTDLVYLWRVGSEHSITRIGIKENNGIPIYNYDLCQAGATVSFMNALHFVRKKHPMSQAILEQIALHMMSHYVTYEECLNERPIFAEQNFFNAKRFYKMYSDTVEDLLTKDALFVQMTQAYMQLIQKEGKAPTHTFDEFMNLLKESTYGGREEWNSIRSRLPHWVTELDKKSGVLGEEGFFISDYEIETSNK